MAITFRLALLAQGIIFMEYSTRSVEETQKLAGQILKETLARPRPGALILALSGELGAGKTAFTQGLAKALGLKEKILSPTFVIMKHFNIAAGQLKNLYHLDCYRLESDKDLDFFNFKEVLKNKNNLVVIEWAERVKGSLPADAVWLTFEHGGGDRRKIIL